LVAHLGEFGLGAVRGEAALPVALAGGSDAHLGVVAARGAEVGGDGAAGNARGGRVGGGERGGGARLGRAHALQETRG